LGKADNEQRDLTLRKLRRRRFRHVRAAGVDALVAFVTQGEDPSAPVREHLARPEDQRWYPVEGGHLVKWPYEDEPFDATYFRVEAGGWDHEHCSACNRTIAAEQSCWITERGSFFVLCDGCRRRVTNLSRR
jgi:hypothetical protein